MTIVTRRLILISLPDGEAYADATWDSPGLNEDGNWIKTGSLVEVVINNTSLTHTVTGQMKRPSGQAVINRDFAPGESQTFTGGGQVQNIEDVPFASLGGVYL